MKKIVFGIFICLCTAIGLGFAQEGVSSSLSDPDPTIIGVDSAKQALREVSVDLFEREGSWNVHISPDNGVISARLFDGSPAGKEALPADAQPASASTQEQSTTVEEEGAVAEEGTEESSSVAGRNMDHDLILLVQDYFGNNFEIYMGKLAFSGWKKMTVAIPPSLDGEHGIVQSSAYYGDRPGLRIVGFRIDCNPMLARGSYYIYFDDLRAVTDLYDIENHDEDDMMDNW